MAYKFMTAEEAASFIKDGFTVGFSGFTASGCPKAVPTAIARHAEEEHAKGNPFKINVFTGASTGDSLDGALARANAEAFRTPYQSSKDLRIRINQHDTHYCDYHLSHMGQDLRYGFFGKMNVAILEVSDITEDGELIPTAGVGIAPTICQLADIIILEHNRQHPKELRGIHDIYQPLDPPYRREIPIYSPKDKIGTPYIKVDPRKIVGIVETNLPGEVSGFSPVDEITMKIGQNVADFLASEIRRGIIPASFLPIQSGVGNVANAVLGCMGANPDIPPFMMYTEVIQDAVIGLIEEGNCSFASGCSLTISNPLVEKVYSNLPFFKEKVVLRPQEISNSPELARRMGLITINTALEADIFGNINSTHVLGTKMMNGIGGSADFTRNGYISIFTTPSVAKNGAISSFVPMVSHLDHSEHSVKVLVSEYGVADLRAKSPIQRAQEIIEKCVHPDYKQLLWDYLKLGQKGHTPQSMLAALAFHAEFNNSGDMRKTDWSKFF
ncbi:MAG: acetyl-CoA hydrolase/transferase family protein [Bacteroidales bacterium]|nr:acetyl-CoA hydrolase/transferase family protein [Bacteroidales bacterium]